jgi:hypothetical protein
MFGKAECETVEQIAEPVARAVQVALSRATSEARHRRDFAAIKRRVAAIEKMLAQL